MRKVCTRVVEAHADFSGGTALRIVGVCQGWIPAFLRDYVRLRGELQMAPTERFGHTFEGQQTRSTSGAALLQPNSTLPLPKQRIAVCLLNCGAFSDQTKKLAAGGEASGRAAYKCLVLGNQLLCAEARCFHCEAGKGAQQRVPALCVAGWKKKSHTGRDCGSVP